MLLPSDVAGMGIWDAGEPLIVVTFLLDFCLAVRSSSIPATSVHVDACVSGIAQDPHSGRSGKRPENRGAPSTARRKAEALLPKGLHSLACRADPRKRLEEVSDRIADLCIGIEHHVAELVINEARGQRTSILATAYLVQDSAPQPGFKDVQLSFTHRSFETEQQAVVEVGRIVHTIF